MKRLFWALFALVLVAPCASASVVVWDQFISFDEVPLSNNQQVGAAYSSYGITFVGDVRYFTPVEPLWQGIEGSHVFNPYGQQYLGVTIELSHIATDIQFTFRAGDGDRSVDTLFSSSYFGAQRDAFTKTIVGTFDDTPIQVIEFRDTAITSISIMFLNPDLGPPCCGFNLDNVYIKWAVPTPSAVVLIGFGLIGLLCFGRISAVRRTWV